MLNKRSYLSLKESSSLISILSVILSYMNCQAHNQMEQYAEIIGKFIRNNVKKYWWTFTVCKSKRYTILRIK